MRHLIVPSQETEFWINKLRENGWLGKGVSVQSYEVDNRLIPISDEAPLKLGEEFSNIVVVELKELTSNTHHYTEKLCQFLESDIIKQHANDWPTSHDRMGDLILLKLKDEIRPYSGQIGMAILQQHKGVRLVLEDRGVVGEWRVRDLHPLTGRTSTGDIVIAENLENLETGTSVKENGNNIWIDPAKVYYSPRLSTERLGTLKAAQELNRRLGRPIIVADPYAGVGPSLIPLIVEAGLVGGILASDLNPVAVEFLKRNLIGRTQESMQITDLEEPIDWAIGCADARQLKRNWAGRFDLLLVNLPHDSLEHLEDLIPLMNSSSPNLIRGWAILEQGDIEDKKNFLQSISVGESDLYSVRSYSPNQEFCVFEIRNNW